MSAKRTRRVSTAPKRRKNATQSAVEHIAGKPVAAGRPVVECSKRVNFVPVTLLCYAADDYRVSVGNRPLSARFADRDSALRKFNAI